METDGDMLWLMVTAIVLTPVIIPGNLWDLQEGISLDMGQTWWAFVILTGGDR